MGAFQSTAPILQRVHHIWLSLPRVAPESPPSRQAFDPTLLAPRDLRYILLLDVIGGPEVETLDFIYRLVGTGVVETLELEFTGLRMSDHLNEHDIPRLMADYRAAVQSRGPQLFRGALQRFGKEWLGYERIALPLTDARGGRVVAILAAVAFDRIDRIEAGRPAG